MELFGSGSSNSAAQLAQLHLKTWEAGLSLRISLQKSLDLSNRVPVVDSSAAGAVEGGVATEELQACLAGVLELLELQRPGESGSKKRKFDVHTADNERTWQHIEEIQADMKRNWKPVVDKWHARLNYGSEKSKSKLKILSSTIWDQVCLLSRSGVRVLTSHLSTKSVQIDRALSDESLMIEKSRPLLMASKRLRKPANEHRPATARDEELYDDTHFYSMLLKVWPLVCSA